MDGKWLGNGLAVITFKHLKSLNLKTLILKLLKPKIPKVFKSETLRISKCLELFNLNIYSSDLPEREVTERAGQGARWPAVLRQRVNPATGRDWAA